MPSERKRLGHTRERERESERESARERAREREREREFTERVCVCMLYGCVQTNPKLDN